MHGVSDAFSADTADARHAWHIFSMRKDHGCILGSTRNIMPYSLVETANQAAQRDCLHATGFGRFLSFVTDKQGVMIGLWLMGLSLLIAGIRHRREQEFRHLLFFASSFTVAFGFYLVWDYLLCPYIINAVRGHPPDRSWTSLSFLPASRFRRIR